MHLFSSCVASIGLFALQPAVSYNSKAVISSAQWGELADQLDGNVILPTDEDYDNEYVLWTATYDHIYPEAVVELGSEEDASIVMKFLLDNGVDDNGNIVDFVNRNCKHSFGGWSTTTGIVIDTSGIDQLYVSDDDTAIVGPGVDLYTFTQFAQENDFTLPHGDCSSVCFGGFLLGGGFGLTSRQFGLGVDWIKSINVVLPSSGELVTVSGEEENEYNDLFWALRGGGQGSFGIITSFEMNIPEKKQTSPGLYVEIVWDYNEEIYDKVADVWNYYVNDDEYGNHFDLYFRLTPDTWLSLDYSVGLHGFWTGEQVDGLMVLAKILDKIDETPSSAKIDYVPFEGWIDHSSSDRTRYSSHCSSRFAFESFDDTFFKRLSSGTLAMQSFSDYDADSEEESTYGIPAFFLFVAPAGGAIASHGSDETVFPWRDAKYLFVSCVRWMNDYDNVKVFAEDWLSNLMTDMEKDGHLSSSSFVNFPDNNIENWSEAYYGDNYAKLRKIKMKYDPNNFFSFAYSVVPENENEEHATQRQKDQKLVEKQPGQVTRIADWQAKHPQMRKNEKESFVSETKSAQNGTRDGVAMDWLLYVTVGAAAVCVVAALQRICARVGKIGKAEYKPLI